MNTKYLIRIKIKKIVYISHHLVIIFSDHPTYKGNSWEEAVYFLSPQTGRWVNPAVIIQKEKKVVI